MNWTVEHGWYGCDTGCCGISLLDDQGIRWDFDFWHLRKGEDPEQYARKRFKRRIQPGDTVTVGDLRCFSDE